MSISDGRRAAKDGQVEEAIAHFSKAKKLDPTLTIEPEQESRKIAADGLVNKAKQSARKGDRAVAVKLFAQAKRLNPSLDLQPEQEADKAFARGLIGRTPRILKESGDVKTVRRFFTEATRLDPSLEITAENWDTLCWYGSLWGHAAEVLDACDKSVSLAPREERYREARGVARALVGDYPGALEDLRVYVKQSQGSGYQKADFRVHEDWIQKLEANQNPFDAKTLKELRAK